MESHLERKLLHFNLKQAIETIHCVSPNFKHESTEVERPEIISRHLATLSDRLAAADRAALANACPWKTIAGWAAELGSLEVEEQVNALLIEAESDFADEVSKLLPAMMATPRRVQPHMTVGQMAGLVEERYGWALSLDLTQPGARAHFWYRSEENSEHRRGERAVDPGVEKEVFVDVAGAVQDLHAALKGVDPSQPLAEFLLLDPRHCHAASRVQLAAAMPYSEIRANLIHRDFLPMDGIRFLLTTMGLEASTPYSTRWVRGVFFQGAPLAHDILVGANGDWILPSLQH